MRMPRFVKEYGNYTIECFKRWKKTDEREGGGVTDWDAASAEVSGYVTACEKGLISPDGCVKAIAGLDMDKFKIKKSRIFYAVQESRTDAWDYGSTNWDKAVEMLKEQGRGLIAAIEIHENPICDICIEEWDYGELFS